jgi:hypothetical protein
MGSPHSSNGVEYRPIEGFPGYEVGNDGSVWTRFNKYGIDGKPYTPWRQMSPITITAGYKRVTLKHQNGTRVPFLVHRLVLTVFRGAAPAKGMECCHGDGVPGNNRLDNLRWGTKKDNRQDAVRHGTLSQGENHYRAKLNNRQVRIALWLLHWNELSRRDIAAILDVSVSTISGIHCGRLWKSVKREN